MVIVRLLQGADDQRVGDQGPDIDQHRADRSLRGPRCFIWGISDGRADARANPDPDRRGDLAMTWLLAGLFAGRGGSGAGGVVHLAVLQEPLRRGARQRGHHVRGVHCAVWCSWRRSRASRWVVGLVDRKADQTPHLHHADGDDERGRHRRVRRGCATRAEMRTSEARDDRSTSRGAVLAEAGQVSQRQHVALHSEADDYPGGHGTDVGVVPKPFRGCAHSRCAPRSAAHSIRHTRRVAPPTCG